MLPSICNGWKSLYHRIIGVTKAKLVLLKLLHLFARDVLVMKKLEIEKTKPTLILSVLKVEY